MLGYRESDIIKMQDNIGHALDYAYDAKDMEVVSGCQEAINFLEGLLVEGII